MLKRFTIVVLIASLLGGMAGYASAEGRRSPHRHRPPEALVHHAVHGELVLGNRDHGYRTVTFDRGKLTQAGAGSVTVERPDGQTVTKTVNGDTKVKGAESADQLQTGKVVLVVSEADTATLIVQRRSGRRAEL